MHKISVEDITRTRVRASIIQFWHRFMLGITDDFSLESIPKFLDIVTFSFIHTGCNIWDGIVEKMRDTFDILFFDELDQFVSKTI